MENDFAANEGRTIDEGIIPAEIVLCERCGSQFTYVAMDWFGNLSLTLTCSSSDCLSSGRPTILLTDERCARFAALCEAFNFLEGRLRKQQESGKLGAKYGKLGGKPTHRKGKKK